jgi:predicted porin
VDGGGAGKSVWSVSSGQMVGSRLDFLGEEDLGGGLKAGFALEAGIDVSTGAGTNGPPSNPPLTSLAFGRTSAVSLGSDSMGYISLGRQYTPLWAVSASGSNDPFYGSWLGGQAVVYSNTVMASNSIVYSYGYTSRTMLLAAPRRGLGFVAMYAFGEATGATEPTQAGRQMGFNVSYGNGPWFTGYAMHQLRGNSPAVNPAAATSDTPRLRQQTLASAYDFGFMRLHAGINRGRNDAPGAARLDRRSWHIGVSAPIAPNQSVRALYGRASNKAAANADWSTFQIGYQYDLSKRTSLYSAWGMIDNEANAQTAFGRSIGTFARGSSPRAFVAGIRHNF